LEGAAISNEQIRLEVESERTNALLERIEHIYLPLHVAAAITFHQAYGSNNAVISRSDYDDALNIAAAALSRLMHVYTMREPREGRVALAVDLTNSQFARGATELRSSHETIGELSVARNELVSALSFIKRMGGRPFAFAVKDF
jgi:hypothetical protein